MMRSPKFLALVNVIGQLSNALVFYTKTEVSTDFKGERL
jgi:hypothetical protein